MPWGPPHNLFELQSKDVQKVPSSGKVSVDDKLECAAVRIVVCDDEAQAPNTHPSFPYDVGVHIENDEVLRRAQRWCEPDGQGWDR
jgi:hypothetical protein